MDYKRLMPAVAGLCLLLCASFLWFKSNPGATPEEHCPTSAQQLQPPAPTQPPMEPRKPNQFRKFVKHGLSEFTQDERIQLVVDFEHRFKPAISNWTRAYGSHAPFELDSVTVEKFAERIGKDATYNEYVFVIDGLTLGIRDARGNVGVDYLNDPQQTKKLEALPRRAVPPQTSMPVSREELENMLQADTGTKFAPNEIRMIPSGLSGSLDGGALIQVGGTPNNAASWKYNLIFGPDGKIAYYLKGAQ